MFKVYTKNSVYELRVHESEVGTYVIEKVGNPNPLSSAISLGQIYHVDRFTVKVGESWRFLRVVTSTVERIEQETTEGVRVIHNISGRWDEDEYVLSSWTPQENDRKNRQEVYQAIDEERDYQDSVWSHSGPNSDGKMTVYKIIQTFGESILCLEEYVKRARNAWTDNANMTESLHMIRKCAAIAVHCMEVHGAPKRNMTDYPSRKS